MNKVVLIILVVAGYWYYSNGGLPFGGGSDGAFDEMGEPEVWMFTFSECNRPCTDARNEMDDRGVSYREIAIDDREGENFKLWKSLGGRAAPHIVIGSEKVGGFSKADIASALGKVFGEEYLTRSENKYYKKHFYSDGSPKIVMYGTTWCPGCKKLRQDFADEGIDYLDFDVEKPVKQDHLMRTLNIGGYPATWVGYTRVKGHRGKDVLKVLNQY